MAKKFVDKIFSYAVLYEAAPEGGYVASVPGLPGCHTQGETLEETEYNIKEAIGLYLESVLHHEKGIPKEPRILQGKVEVRIPV